MQIDIERESVGNECLIFSSTAGRRGNLFADLSRVVIGESRGLGILLRLKTTMRQRRSVSKIDAKLCTFDPFM